MASTLLAQLANRMQAEDWEQLGDQLAHGDGFTMYIPGIAEADVDRAANRAAALANHSPSPTRMLGGQPLMPTMSFGGLGSG